MVQACHPLSLPEITIGHLASIVHGELKLGSMPPLGGAREPTGRIVTDPKTIQQGDTYWAQATSPCGDCDVAQEVFLRGGFGVITSSHTVVPWAGKFVLFVADGPQAWRRMSDWCRLKGPLATNNEPLGALPCVLGLRESDTALPPG
jgi:hypothetical protein